MTLFSVRNAAALVVLVGSPLVAAAVGGLASVNAAGFYQTLQRPSWAPPPWLFGPVWTALYLMMGVAAFLVWRRAGARALPILGFFLAHLVINALWSWLFFAWRLGTVSIAGIAVLWIMIAVLTIAFFRVRAIAGALFVPYLAWVSFATALNVAIVTRNANAFQ